MLPGISELAAKELYASRGIDPRGNTAQVLASISGLTAVTLLDLTLLTYIFTKRGFKDNTLLKSMITQRDLNRRNRKNAVTVGGHFMGCLMTVSGQLIGILVVKGMGHFAVYFISSFNVIYGTVFQFFQILVTPELRKFVFSKGLFSRT